MHSSNINKICVYNYQLCTNCEIRADTRCSLCCDACIKNYHTVKCTKNQYCINSINNTNNVYNCDRRKFRCFALCCATCPYEHTQECTTFNKTCKNDCGRMKNGPYNTCCSRCELTRGKRHDKTCEIVSLEYCDSFDLL